MGGGATTREWLPWLGTYHLGLRQRRSWEARGNLYSLKAEVWVNLAKWCRMGSICVSSNRASRGAVRNAPATTLTISFWTLWSMLTSLRTPLPIPELAAIGDDR